MGLRLAELISGGQGEVSDRRLAEGAALSRGLLPNQGFMRSCMGWGVLPNRPACIKNYTKAVITDI